ncbi:hypothetical protein HY637_03135 [Candidatus Woesearchaeota archaeon]|nr:hypothetical protein [Candidatus Woesearchaeota archaeon]
MNAKIVVLLVLVVGVLLVGCNSASSDGYATYNQQQGQQQNQYVGGGCGVAAESDYEAVPASQATGL